MSAFRPGNAESDAEHRDASQWALVCALTAVGLALRLFHLNSGLWIDEISSLLDSFRQPLHLIVSTYPKDTQHPLYSLLASASIRLLGEAPWTARLPAVVFGTASIPLLYLLGRETLDRRRGLLAAAFLTVSYHHVWFSQNARGYTVLAFFSIASTLLLVRGLRTSRIAYFAAYAVSTALGAYTHLTMVFLAVGHAVIVAGLLIRRSTRYRASIGQTAVAFGGAAALTVLFYAPALSRLIAYFGKPTDMATIATPSWAIAETIRMLRIGFGWTLAIVLVIVCLAGGCWRMLRRDPLILGLFVVPAAVTIVGAALARGTMYPRFFFFLCGFAALIMVEGAFWAGDQVARVPRLPLSGQRIGTAFMLPVILASAIGLQYNYRFPKQDFQGAVSYIAMNQAAAAKPAVVGTARNVYNDYMGLHWPVLNSEEDLENLRRRGPVWLVYTFPRYVASSFPGVWRTAEEHCALSSRLRGTVGDGDVYVLLCPQSPSP